MQHPERFANTAVTQKTRRCPCRDREIVRSELAQRPALLPSVCRKPVFVRRPGATAVPSSHWHDGDALLREFDTTTPLGALLVALMPLPAAWALVWVDYLSTNTVMVSVFFAVMWGLLVCLSMQGSRPQ